MRRDESAASLAIGSWELDRDFDLEDGFDIPLSPVKQAYDETLRPLICHKLPIGRDIAYTSISESCRAYRMFPANRFMWYHFAKGDISSRRAVLGQVQKPITFDDPITKIKRTFVFLLTTESRLRVGQACFFEETPDLTAKDVRNAFGDLESVFMKDGVGKYVARMGLSFTKTKETIRIPPESVAVVDDIPAPDGKDYTDGCGCISEEAANEIAGTLGLDFTPTSE
jgi:hypothetical protein